MKRKELHQFLSSAVAQSYEGIGIADLNNKIIYVNSAWATMYGYATAEELIGKSIHIFHNQEQIDKEVTPFIQIVMQKGVNSAEVSHIRQDGTTSTKMMTTKLLKMNRGSQQQYWV